jgi:hypothetical protein
MKQQQALSKAEIWRERIKEWRESGLPQRLYCRNVGLPLATFGFWKRRLSEPLVEQFVRLPAAGTRFGKRLTLNFPEGFRVIFNEHTPVQTITAVVEQLCASTGKR